MDTEALWRVSGSSPPSSARAGEELAGALMELYGEGLERIVDAVADEGSDALRARLVDDGAVASVLLMHGLYPVAARGPGARGARERAALHGDPRRRGRAARLEDGVARIRLEGHCRGCSASASTLELGIRQALEAAAPDLEGLVVEGVLEEPTHGPPSGAILLPMVRAAHGGGNGRSGAARGLAAACRGSSARRSQLAGVGRRVGPWWANLDGDLLAYRDACAACGAAGRRDARGRHAQLRGVLALVRAAPRGPLDEGSGLQLEPLPLLRDGGEIRVAVAA